MTRGTSQGNEQSVVAVPAVGKWQGGSSPDLTRPAASADGTNANYSEDTGRYGIDQAQVDGGLVLLVRLLPDPKVGESKRFTHVVVLSEQLSINSEQLRALCGECFLPEKVERVNFTEKAGAPCLRCVAVAQYAQTRANLTRGLRNLAARLPLLANRIENDELNPKKLEELADIFVEVSELVHRLASGQRLAGLRPRNRGFGKSNDPASHVDWR